MCTAISYKPQKHYFGRNLDLEHRFHEAVTITPRNYPMNLRLLQPIKSHYAMIGMASVVDGFPLYYDATNECGLSIAALNFPGNAVYNPPIDGKLNLTSFEIIPYIMGKFQDIEEVTKALTQLNITNIAFSNEFPTSPLHWMIADQNRSVVVEQTSDGLAVYDNTFHILTNNPPFPYHVQNLANYMNLTSKAPSNRFAPDLKICAYSRAMGAIGLPGDASSASRFIRSAFVLHNSISDGSDADAIAQFFHILGSVEQQRGCVRLEDDLEITIYSSCCDTNAGIYYYTTYQNPAVTAISMHNEDLDSKQLVQYPLRTTLNIHYEN